MVFRELSRNTQKKIRNWLEYSHHKSPTLGFSLKAALGVAAKRLFFIDLPFSDGNV
jgi:hypothetical protein